MADLIGRSAHVTETGTVFDQRVILMDLYVSPNGTAGDVVLREGNTSGPERLRLNLSKETTGRNVKLPGDGMMFNDGLAVSNLPNGAVLTLFVK